ncbi:hypothetical protein [Streptomyces sp. NPDC001889]
MTATVSLPSAWTAQAAEALRAAADHRAAITAMLGYLPLPAPTVVARPEAVYVSVAKADDLGCWLEALGGEIHRSVPFEGVQLWSLRTFTPPGASGARVPIRVSVPLPVGESVMPELARALAVAA